MSRLLRLDAALLASTISICGIAGSALAAEPPSYKTMSKDLEPLRSAFNAAPDNVRAILLASPT